MRRRIPTESDLLSSSEVVARLKTVRIARGLSASDLARTCGLSATTIYNLESGRRSSPTLDETLAICRALGLDLREVLSGTPLALAV